MLVDALPMPRFGLWYVPGPGVCRALADNAPSGRVDLPKPKRGDVRIEELYCTAFMERIW